MLGLRLRPRVTAVLTGGTIALTGGCKPGGEDTETDTDSDPGTGTDSSTDTEGPTTGSPTTLTPTTVTPTTEPPPPPVDTTPPQMIAVELLDPQILRVTFTEAIAPVDLVNPKRFRLSVGRYRPAYYYSSQRTVYYDLGVFNTPECDYYYEPCYYEPPLPVDGLDVLPDAYNPAQVIVLLTNPIFPRVCQIAAQAADPNPPGARGGLFLHYAGGGNSEITDLVGLPLADIGVEWIKFQDDYMAVDYANFPELNPFLPIPCPF